MQKKTSRFKPFVIGITGNIGTGKSLVRKMLRHFGALSVDADELAHAAYEKGSEGFLAIREAFGNRVVGKSGGINREKLADIVFNDTESLQKLESIIHPIVTATLTRIISRPPLPIIAVEAVKLLESGLPSICDKIWVVDAPEETLYERLQSYRGMTKELVDERLRHQTPLSEITASADVVIRNDGSVTDLWDQVISIWKEYQENLEIFSRAMEITSRIMAPFKPYLLFPSFDNTDYLEKRLARNFFKWKDTEKWLSAAGNTTTGNRERMFLLLIVTQIWEFGSRKNSGCLVISDVSKLAARICGFSANIDEEKEELKDKLAHIEDYYRLQLCSRILLPNKGKMDVLESIGYYPFKGKDEKLETQLKAEYNLYTKELQPAHSIIDEQ